jgi:hypothetical protein
MYLYIYMDPMLEAGGTYFLRYSFYRLNIEPNLLHKICQY